MKRQPLRKSKRDSWQASARQAIAQLASHLPAAPFTWARYLLLALLISGSSAFMTDGIPVESVRPPSSGEPGEPFYPLCEGSWWLFDSRTRTEQGVSQQNVKATLTGSETIDGVSYSLFAIGEEENFEMFIRRDAAGVHIRKMRFPVADWAMDIYLNFKPELTFLKFPLKEEKWSYKGEIAVWKFNIDINIDYENLGKETVQTPAGEMECYRIRERVRVMKKDYVEESYYARGVGFVKGVSRKAPEVLVDYHIPDTP
jgi:hypothetical protein